MTSPSPWAVEASPRGALDSWYVQDAIGEDVCRVRGGEATTEANARLIAAAPELLQVASRADTTYQNVLEVLREYAETDEYAATLVEQLTDAGAEARELIARVGL